MIVADGAGGAYDGDGAFIAHQLNEQCKQSGWACRACQEAPESRLANNRDPTQEFDGYSRETENYGLARIRKVIPQVSINSDCVAANNSR
jgi:hypothetical protein